MGVIPWIVSRLSDLWWLLWDIYLAVMDIPLIGEPIGSFILSIQDIVSLLITNLWEFDAWVTEVAGAIRDILSWDAILDRLYLYFPFLRDIVSQIQDTIRGFVDMTFPWVYDPELTIRGFMDRWLDIYFPWLRDPELTIWGWLEWRVKELIPDLPDIGAVVAERVREWIDEHLMAWLENRAVDIGKMAGRILERLW